MVIHNTQPQRFSDRNSGFTLIELLIAMAIFAVLASVAYFSLNSLIKQSQVIESANTTLAKLQRAMTLIERDFMQSASRSIRDESNGSLPALLLQADNTIEFTRSGYPDLQQKQSRLIRVRYQYQDNRLVRQSWSVLDRASNQESADVDLLEDVEDFTVQVLGDDDWQSSWPPDALVNPDEDVRLQQAKKLPRAMKLVIKVKGFGEITRLIPGVLR